MLPTADPASAWWVICLCAEWCGVCREWREAFTLTAAAHPELRFAWVDVEDEAEAMGDVDIETFPTLLIAHQDRPLFFGPLQPSGAQFTRLIASLQESSPALAKPDEAGPLFRRLASTVLRKS
ncbi:MAG: thioredoxin family protein [Ramlibacter sp.]|nr:thioredoxin family protein [Ramlibacter sp.]